MDVKAKVVTYQGMTAMVNPKNPGFNNYTKRNNKYIEVHAIISDGTKAWREKFKVSFLSKAEEQIKEVIQFFNDTRRLEPPIEKERFFVEMYIEDEEVARYEDDKGMSGWLDPDGVFHPCGFGQHVDYALEIINKDADFFTPVHSDEMEDLAQNSHIPMSVVGQSTGSFVSILGQITPPQVDWFNRFFFKLCPRTQRQKVISAAEKQGIKLKYEW
jgi:hypothetical protein